MQSMILELQKQVASFAKQKPPAQTRQQAAWSKLILLDAWISCLNGTQ
jgi:hypothetical protein